MVRKNKMSVAVYFPDSDEEFAKVLFQSSLKGNEELDLPSKSENGAYEFGELTVSSNSYVSIPQLHYFRGETSFCGSYLGCRVLILLHRRIRRYYC